MRTVWTWGVVGLAWCLLGVSPAFAGRRASEAKRGKQLYERHCLSCHGANAHGDGPAVPSLVVPVPDLAGWVTAKNLSTQSKVVLRGQGSMPAFEASLTESQALTVLKHVIRLLDQPEAKP